MQERLEELARKLHTVRGRGNKLSLEHVLESGRILEEARSLSGRGFHRWLKERGHMTRDTARRHLRVTQFIRESGLSISHFAKLGLAKLYALSTLDSAAAAKYLRGELKFSKPLEELSDVRFRQEFRERFPIARKRRNREHVFREVFGAITRLRKALERGRKFAGRLSEPQRRRVAEGLKSLAETAGPWEGAA